MSASGELEFVDAHHHLQDYENGRYPWLAPGKAGGALSPDISPLRRDYTLRDLKADLAGVRLVKSVHVQNQWDPTDPVGETAWLQGIADAEGFPQAIVAFADLADPTVEGLLEAHAAYPNMRGIRQILDWHEDPTYTVVLRRDLMESADWRRGYALLRRFGLSFDLQLYPEQLDMAFDLVRAFPDTPVVLNHFAKLYDESDAGIARWTSGLRLLAQAPNVSVKLSGFGIGRYGWNVDDVWPLMARVIDIFGVDRCMCGSNLPFDRLYRPPSCIVAMLKRIAAEVGPSDAPKLLRTNAEKAYRI
jgi:predicted TIM-barrel fold metal-dependent hydrolase